MTINAGIGLAVVGGYFHSHSTRPMTRQTGTALSGPPPVPHEHDGTAVRRDGAMGDGAMGDGAGRGRSARAVHARRR
jgi:hypothetical protein